MKYQSTEKLQGTRPHVNIASRKKSMAESSVSACFFASTGAMSRRHSPFMAP